MTPEEIEKVIDDFAKKFPDLVKEMDKYDDTLKLLIKSQIDLKVTGIDLDKNLKKLCESVIRARKAFDDMKRGLSDVGSSMQDHSKQIDSLGKAYAAQNNAVKQSTDQTKKSSAQLEAALKKEIEERDKASKQISESFGKMGGIVMAGFSNALLDAAKNALRSGNALDTASGLMSTGINVANQAVQAGATGVQSAGTALSAMGGKFKLAGGLVSALGGAAGAASGALSALAVAGVGFMMAETQKMITGFQTMSQAGAIYAGGMKEMTSTANSAGMTLDQFSKVTAANKDLLSKSGLGVAESSKKMARAMEAGGEKARLSMYALGMGMEEQAETYATVMAKMSAGTGKLQSSDQEIAAATSEYASNLKLLNTLTGEDAKTRKAKVEQETNTLAFQQKMNTMSEAERLRLTQSMEGMNDVQRRALQERIVYGTIISKDVAVAEANNSGVAKMNRDTFNSYKNHQLTVDEASKIQAKHNQEITDQNTAAVGIGQSQNATAQASGKLMLDAQQKSVKFTEANIKAAKDAQKKVQEDALKKDPKDPGAADLMEAQQKFAVSMQDIANKNLPLFTTALITTIAGMQKAVDALSSGNVKQSLMDMFDPKLLLEVLGVALIPVGGMLVSGIIGMFKGGAAKAAKAAAGAATSAAGGAGGSLAGKAMDGVASGAEKLGGGVGKGAQTALQGIAQGLKAIASPQVLLGLGALTLAAMGIGKALQWAEPAITSIGATLVKVFQTAAPVVIKLIETIGDVVKTAITTAGKVINDLATTFVNFISSADPAKLAAIGLALVPLGAGLIAFGAGALVATPGLVGLGAGLALLGAALAILPLDSKVLLTLGKNLKQFVSDTPYLEMLAAAPGLAAFSLGMLPLAGAIKILDGTVSTSLLSLGKNLKSFLDDAPYIRMNAAGPGMALFGLGLLPLANAMKSITGVKPESLSELGTALSNFFKAAPMADLKTAAGPMESFSKAIESYKGKAGDGFEKFNKELKSLQQTDAKKLVEVADAMKKIKDSMPEEKSWFSRTFGGGTGQIPVGKVEPGKEEQKPTSTSGPQIPQEVKKRDEVATGEAGKPVGASSDMNKYLKSIALIESGGDRNAKAGTSSAGGLFQFTKGTWAEMTKEMGKDYKDEDKFDPKKAAEVAEYFSNKQKNQMEKGLGRSTNNTDMYMGHFLGAGGATKFLKAKDQDPNQSAAALDRKAAAANENIYYEKAKDGSKRERSVKEVYDLMDKKVKNAEMALDKGKWGKKGISDDVANITAGGGAKGISKTVDNSKAVADSVKAEIALKESEEQKLAKKTLDAKFADIKAVEMKKADLSKMTEAERMKFVTDLDAKLAKDQAAESVALAKKALDTKFADIKAAEMKKVDLSKMSVEERAKFEKDLDAKLAKDKAAEVTKQGIDGAKEVAKSTIKINGKVSELGAGPSMDDLKKKADDRQAAADKAETDAKPKTSQGDIRKLDAQMDEKSNAEAQIKPAAAQTATQRGVGFSGLGVNVGAENRRNPLNIGSMVSQAADAGAANLSQQKAFYEQQKTTSGAGGEMMGPPPPHPEMIAALNKIASNGEKHIELQSVALEHASQMASTMDDNKRYTREIMKSSR
jgi:hypothetical protein